MNKRDGAMRRLFCLYSNPPAGPVGLLRKGLGCGRIFRMGFRNVDEASFDELQFFFSRLQIFFGDVLRIEQNDLVSTGLLSFVQGAVRKIDTVVHSQSFVVFRNANRNGDVQVLIGKMDFCVRNLFTKAFSYKACPAERRFR